MPSSVPFVVLALIAITAVSSFVFANDPNNLPPVHAPTGLTLSVGSTDPSNALQLRLSINATTMGSGQTMNISVSEYNPQTHPNNVTGSTDWPIQELSTGPCGPINNPMGVAVFEGYYTSANVSSATPLTMYAPGIYACPAEMLVKAYLFNPTSSLAALYGSCSPEPCFQIVTSASLAFSGYWTGTAAPGATGGGDFHSFPRGVYTIAAGDEWGELEFLYFVVS